MNTQDLKNLFGDSVRFWTGSMPVEEAAVKLLQNIAQLPILAGHIAVMPDVHMGKGATGMSTRTVLQVLEDLAAGPAA